MDDLGRPWVLVPTALLFPRCCSRPAATRWDHIAKDFKEKMPAVITYFDSVIPAWALPLIEGVAARLNKYFREYGEEMAGVAQALNVSKGLVVMLNLVMQLEAIGVKLERDQRDVARIHGLEFETFDGVGLEVGVGDEVLDRVEDFLEHGALLDSGFEHGRSGRWGVKYRALACAVTAEIWKKNLKFGGFQVEREREESTTGERARKRV